jgi:hypothetical protein
MNTHKTKGYSVVMTLIAMLSVLSLQLKSQERLNVYARVGANQLYADSHVNINNHEAYITANEVDLDNPIFYGIEVSYNVAPNWRINGRVDVSTEYSLTFFNITNKYVLSHNKNIEELIKYKFAPVFFDFNLGHRFSLFKELEVLPNVGFGMRMINKKGYEAIYSNSTPDLNQLELANIAYNSSFDQYDPFWQIGLSLTYSRFYMNASLKFSLKGTTADDFEFEGALQPNRMTQNFAGFSLGYKIWTQY